MAEYDVVPFAGIGRFSERDLNKMARVAELVGAEPNCLANVIGIESGFRPDIRNPNGGATGLIQFMPFTAKRFGTTTAALARMSSFRQLDFVYRHYRPFRGRLERCRDLYLATFLPAFIGKPDDFILAAKDDPTRLIEGSSLTRGQVYAANSVLDQNQDGTITPHDLDLLLLGRDTVARANATANPALMRRADTSDTEALNPRPTTGGSGSNVTGTLIPIGLTVAGFLVALALGKR